MLSPPSYDLIYEPPRREERQGRGSVLLLAVPIGHFRKTSLIARIGVYVFLPGYFRPLGENSLIARAKFIFHFIPPSPYPLSPSP